MLEPGRPRLRVASVVALALFLTFVGAGPAHAAGEVGEQLSVGRAMFLGAVEGATEFIPVSSTGHLVVADHLLGGSDEGPGRAELDSFLIVVQGGAIAAVMWLYRRRISDVVRGVRRAGPGRRLGIVLVIAAAPALLAGAIAGSAIKDRLLEPLPVALAWILGGGLILLVASWYRRQENGGGRSLELLDRRTALLIGIAQVAALWPGVSRSLVTILAGVALGLSVAAAVEFSFLLGAIVLSAATANELLLGDGALTADAVPVAAGLLVAFVTATFAVGWMVRFLERRDLSVFGWYRLAAGGATIALVLGGTLHA